MKPNLLGSSGIINVRLENTSTQLTDVVVVGCSAKKKTGLTGQFQQLIQSVFRAGPVAGSGWQGRSSGVSGNPEIPAQLWMHEAWGFYE